MKHIYLLALLLLLCTCDRARKRAPQMPDHPGYLFKYTTKVPTIEHDVCHPGWLETYFSEADYQRDERLSGYAVNAEEAAEVVSRLEEHVFSTFAEIEGEEAERVIQIGARMRPFLPEELRHTQIHFVRHKLVGDEYINAFTFPNHIFLTSGLWELADNDHQLAMVIGHEFGHLTSKHFEEIFQAKQRWVERLRYVGIESETGSIAATIIEEILTVPFGQADELESDLIGSYLATSAGYDPELGAEVFSRFATIHNPGRSFWSKLSSSHPEPKHRKACIDAYIMAAVDSANHVYAGAMVDYKNALAVYEADPYESSLLNFDSIKPSWLCLLGIFTGGGLILLQYRSRRVKGSVRILGFLITLVSVLVLVVLELPGYTLQSTSHLVSAETSTCLYGEEDGCKSVESIKEVRTISGELMLRQSPSHTSTIVGRLESGATVYCYYCSKKDTIIGRPGRWCLVQDGEDVGWSWGWHLW